MGEDFEIRSKTLPFRIMRKTIYLLIVSIAILMVLIITGAGYHSWVITGDIFIYIISIIVSFGNIIGYGYHVNKYIIDPIDKAYISMVKRYLDSGVLPDNQVKYCILKIIKKK
ncbi:Hypothetical protein CM240_2867 [Clostridium bornimense]|uniref:Uncharacterized protein n=1 Tax=Clostridium bornimense TaxID=1216932 RepID=W6S272_9CLOT|nr:hypothetical protein [Clostridium bornimense]CDM69984.1 Hypothetical protein CM240_2867 [Clostridium bornimense]